MINCKMTLTLLCMLVVGHHVQAVVNKAASQTAANAEEEKKNEIKADERISNSYGPPLNDYGPPLGSGPNGPAPVYGPPELVGDHGHTHIYAPPPPELPPPAYGPPLSSYGPPRNMKPHGPLKQSFGPPLSVLPLKPGFVPPKLHHGPPKQHYGPPPPAFVSFRPPKPQYGPPLKFNAPLVSPNLPLVAPSNHGPPKSGHGPPIPISVETYGPPLPTVSIQFNSVQQGPPVAQIPHRPPPGNQYGPPPPGNQYGPPPPGNQYGPPPSGNQYGPPPQGPPPGVAAPPTPPDIKYDGWQPIAGLTTQHGASGSHGSSHSENSNVPSDSYGVPIHSPEAQDLKTSVHESSASSESNGLPPPPLPQYEPLHTDHQSPAKVHESHHTTNLQFDVPKVEPLSIVKTVGFELLPNAGALTSDLQSLSVSEAGGLSHNHLSHSIGSGQSLSTLQTGNFDSGSHEISLGHLDSNGFQTAGNELSLLQVSQGPSNNYGPPLPGVSFGKVNTIGSGIPLPPPPPSFDSYSAPPLSSYSPNGPYAAAQSGRASSSPLSSFGFHSNSFHKHGFHNRHHGSFRAAPPLPPLGSLIPPRNREPIKFREQVPSGLLFNLHRYLPDLRPNDLPKPPKFIAPLSFGPQLPSLNAPVAFHQSYGSGNAFSSSFGSSGSFSKSTSHKFNSALAAPNAQYGTPLSFVDFNTPAPILTYGAPNFGPASSFVSTSNGFGNNLYHNLGNVVTTTYGTPVVNAPQFNAGHDCGFQHSSEQLSIENTNSHVPNLDVSVTNFPKPLPPSPPGNHINIPSISVNIPDNIPSNHHPGSIGDHLVSSLHPPAPEHHHSNQAPGLPTSIGVDQGALFKVAVDAVSNSLSGVTISPSVNHLDLSSYEQQKTDLKDSYGNPIGISYESSEEDNSLSADHNHAQSLEVTNVLSPPLPSDHQHAFSLGNQFHQEGGISAEALTASLTTQGFGHAKSFGSHEVDASQFLSTDEGSQALSLAQGLTADGSDGFQIQGSKGTYTLQIQAADGGLGTENSDGSIRHEQVLSNGLLQDILAAIEQPNQGHIQLQGLPQAQPLEEVYSDAPQTLHSAVPKGHFIKAEGLLQKKDVEKLVANAGEISKKISINEGADTSKSEGVALFFNNRHSDSIKEIRSVPTNEKAASGSENQTKQ